LLADRQFTSPVASMSRLFSNTADQHTTPKPPVTPRPCLIVLGHGAILLPLCRRAQRKWLVWFSPSRVLSY